MPELEYITLSSGSRLQQPQASAAASNSNSATSIQAALRTAPGPPSGSMVSMDQRGDALGGISVGSGSAASGSIPYVEDPILGALGSPRPTSPDMLGANAASGQAAAGGTTSTVKSLRSWFLPTAKQQQQQTSVAGNFGMTGSSGNNNTTSTTTTTAISSSNNLNTNNTTATATTTTTAGTNNLTINITKNSPNSEDNSSQGSFSLIFLVSVLCFLFIYGSSKHLWLLVLLSICDKLSVTVFFF